MTCDEVRKLLIEQSIIFSEKDKEKAGDHIAHCIKCRNFIKLENNEIYWSRAVDYLLCSMRKYS